MSFGDLTQQSLNGILSGEKRMNYAKKASTLPLECMDCEWKNACHNGCTGHRIGGISERYFYCETRKAVFAYLKEKVEEWNQNKALTSTTGETKWR
jgi:sulfatase maturation enzyme AslB (radical SAM superfamily)